MPLLYIYMYSPLSHCPAVLVIQPSEIGADVDLYLTFGDEEPGRYDYVMTSTNWGDAVDTIVITAGRDVDN